MTIKKSNNKKNPGSGSKSSEAGSGIHRKEFPVVGIGASAGGLDALRSFFAKVTKNSNMAYIVVIHMAPKQPSMLPELLQRVCPIPVSSANDGETVEPDHVYVIPPNKEISLFNNKIQLLDIAEKGVPHPIDVFLSSLGQDKKSLSVGIILSGTGTDGTNGIKEIKENGGLILVQSEKSAGYSGMPLSARRTGLVDLVLKSEDMPPRLREIFSNNVVINFNETNDDATTEKQQQEWLHKVFAILRTKTGVDFSRYKLNTILRRIGRRMMLNNIERNNTYVKFLRENPQEIETLFHELLIGVTNFFRDPESMEVLKKSVFPALIGQMNDNSTIRVWVPGCSTGEEVYSLAIIIRECLDQTEKGINVQIFGTDINESAINKAREGIYPVNIVGDITKERLNRFFTNEGEAYRIRKELRDYAVFSVQDVLRDPPFSKLHLLCCRNLLIYLNSDTQKTLLPLFHYTLTPKGILMLGSSETIGGYGNLFKVIDKKWKIFQHKEVPNTLRQIVDFPSGTNYNQKGRNQLHSAALGNQMDIKMLTQQKVLGQFAPTAILTDGDGVIIHVLGRTGKYLETPSGAPTHNILDLARQGLRIELSSAMRVAKSSGQNETRNHIPVRTNGDVQLIDLHVCPQKSPRELSGYFLIVFEDVKATGAPVDSKKLADDTSKDTSRIAKLEKEIQITRESHQTTIEELETSNEELKSTNEEMQSSNEELHSSNEELESSKEELQSLNEELQTVNNELQSKVEELSAVHDDMNNLLNSTEIASIFLDVNMCIRRFTPKVTSIVNLIQGDIGRPLEQIVSNLTYDQIISDCKAVLEKLVPRKIEVQTKKGYWYSMRLIPYRTMENLIDGVVLTFTSVNDQKKAQIFSEKTMDLMRNIFDTLKEPIAVLDSSGNMVIANTSLASLFKIKQHTVKNLDLLNATVGKAKKTELKNKLGSALQDAGEFEIRNYLINDQKYTIKAFNIPQIETLPYRILLKFFLQE